MKRNLSKMIQRLRAGIASDDEIDQLDKFWNDALQDTTAIDALSEREKQELKDAIFAAIKAKISRLNRSTKQ